MFAFWQDLNVLKMNKCKANPCIPSFTPEGITVTGHDELMRNIIESIM